MHNLKIYRSILLSSLRIPSYLFYLVFQKKIDGIVLINESSAWVIDDISRTIKSMLGGTFNIKIDLLPFFYSNKIIHYGSIHSITKNRNIFLGRGNKVIISIYHIDIQNDEFRSKIFFLLKIVSEISLIIVPNAALYRWFIENNFPPKKILLIPIAYDGTNFNRLSNAKRFYRKKYDIPSEKCIVGSFQKDGNNWSDGLMPKYIKGPDVFVDVLKKISKKYNICCLLTGPSRGYVISQLKSHNIDYVYYDATKDQLPELYTCLDFYLITSRIEGGPKGLMEAMASGVPVVSTRVGMATDIIQHGQNGMINNVEDVDGLVCSINELLNNDLLKDKLINNALNCINQYSWDAIIKKYDDVYRELIIE
jgi:glycosyltransferase involved in cell wall biosynthesis